MGTSGTGVDRIFPKIVGVAIIPAHIVSKDDCWSVDVAASAATATMAVVALGEVGTMFAWLTPW